MAEDPVVVVVLGMEVVAVVMVVKGCGRGGERKEEKKGEGKK